MKIAWFHSHFQNWMGGTKYVFEVCKRLKDKQEVDNITIFVETASDNNRERFENAGIKVVPLLRRSSYDPIYWLFLPLYLQRMSKRLRYSHDIGSYDVLIASMFPMNWLISLLNTSGIFQVCYEPYALFFDKHYRQGLPLIKRIVSQAIRLLYERYDIYTTSRMQAVMTISQYNADWIKRVYDREARVVYEGVDTTFFRKRTEGRLSASYRNSFVIFHSTDFTSIKNTWFILRQMPKIVQLIPNCKLLMSITRDSPAKEEMLKLATQNGFAEHLELLGFVPIEKMPYLYSLADVVVQPSVKQSASLSIKEAMACEAVVIRSNDVPQEEIIDGVNGFLISPYNPDDLIETLVKIRQMSDDDREEMGKQARETVINKYTWDKVTDRILSIIKGNLNRG